MPVGTPWYLAVPHCAPPECLAAPRRTSLCSLTVPVPRRTEAPRRLAAPRRAMQRLAVAHRALLCHAVPPDAPRRLLEPPGTVQCLDRMPCHPSLCPAVLRRARASESQRPAVPRRASPCLAVPLGASRCLFEPPGTSQCLAVPCQPSPCLAEPRRASQRLAVPRRAFESLWVPQPNLLTSHDSPYCLLGQAS